MIYAAKHKAQGITVNYLKDKGRTQAKARLNPTTTTSRALQWESLRTKTTRTSVGNVEKEPISKDINAQQLIRSVDSAWNRDIMRWYIERRNLLYTRSVLNQIWPQWLSTPMKMAQSPTPLPTTSAWLGLSVVSSHRWLMTMMMEN